MSLEDALRRRDLWWSGSTEQQKFDDLNMFAGAARKVVDLEKLDLLSGTCDVWPVCSNCSALGRFGEFGLHEL